MPSSFKAVNAALALSFGGSKNAKNPTKTNSFSSSMLNSPTGAGFSLYPKRTTRKPS